MFRKTLLPQLCLFLSFTAFAQLPSQILLDAQTALNQSQPNRANTILNSLSKDKWQLAHKEMLMQVRYAHAEFEKVSGYAEELKRTYSLSASARLIYTKANIRLGQLNDAIVLLEEIRHDILPEQYQLAMGLVAFEMEDYEMATRHFEAAIAINPEEATAWAWQGLALEKTNDWSRAKLAYQFAVNLNPHCGEAYLGLIRAMIQDEDLTSALALCQKAIKYVPESKAMLLAGAELALDLANYDLARSYSHQALKLYPKLGAAYAQLGLSYFFVQDYDRAVSYLEQATTFRKDGGDYYFLALAAIRNRRMQLAHHSLEVALSLGFEREDLAQLVEHCKSILASFDEPENFH